MNTHTLKKILKILAPYTDDSCSIYTEHDEITIEFNPPLSEESLMQIYDLGGMVGEESPDVGAYVIDPGIYDSYVKFFT